MKEVELQGEKLFENHVSKHSLEAEISILNITTGEQTTEKATWWLLSQDDYIAIKGYVQKLEAEIAEHREIDKRRGGQWG